MIGFVLVYAVFVAAVLDWKAGSVGWQAAPWILVPLFFWGLANGG